jgi:lysozyme
VITRPIPWYLAPYLEREEGEKFKAYKDQAGVWTDGDGSTSGVTATTVWTEAQVQAHLMVDLSIAVHRLYLALRPAAIVALHDYEYAALLSFVDNVGEQVDWEIWAAIERGDLAGVPQQMRRFVLVNGKRDPGLINRRNADVGLWLGQDPVLKLKPPVVVVAPPVVPPPPAPKPAPIPVQQEAAPMIKLHIPPTLITAAPRSWLSEILDSFVHGVEGAPPVAIDTTKPIGAALAPVVQAATALGTTVTAAATGGLNTLLESTVGPPGTALADLFLTALIQEATAKLTPAAAAKVAAPPT